MNLTRLKKEWTSGKIDKWNFIDKMYKAHALFFQYADFIKSTNISKIEISDNGVVMTFRDSGIKFILSPGDKRLVPLEVINFGDYERSELEMQMKLIKPGFSILDIGANYGWFSIHIARLFPTVTVYSFEPIASTYEYLNKNIKLNNIDNIESFNFGFADVNGSFTFYFDPQLSANASLARLSNVTRIIEEKCNIKKLDDFILSRKLKYDFIKCDVEGAELLVFKGSIETISKFKPIIFTEMLRKWSSKFNYHPNDIINFFRNLNYRCFTLQNKVLMPLKQVDENTIETNYFFLHEEKHLQEILEHGEKIY